MRSLLGSRFVRATCRPLIALAVVGLIAGAGSAWFGSFHSLLAYLHGDVLAFDPPVFDVGTVEWGTPVEGIVRVRNLTNKSIRIQGAAADCSCFSVRSPLPLVVPPFGSVELEVAGRARGAKSDDDNGPMEHSLYLYLDAISPEVVFTIQGSIYGAENHRCKPQ